VTILVEHLREKIPSRYRAAACVKLSSTSLGATFGSGIPCASDAAPRCDPKVRQVGGDLGTTIALRENVDDNTRVRTLSVPIKLTACSSLIRVRVPMKRNSPAADLGRHSKSFDTMRSIWASERDPNAYRRQFFIVESNDKCGSVQCLLGMHPTFAGKQLPFFFQ